MFWVSPKTKNMLWTTFVVSDLPQQTFALFYWTRFFDGNVILRIDKYPQNQFRYTVPGQFQFFLFHQKKRKEKKNQTNKLTKRCNSLFLFFLSIEKFFKKNHKLTDVFTLEIFISSSLECALEWNLLARGTPFMEFIDANHTLKISTRVYVYKICFCLDGQFVQPI